MKYSQLRSVAAVLTFAGASALAHAGQDAKRRIHGSWVNVRATAAADAPVIDHLITNTPVVLRAETGKSCEIGWNRDGQDRAGFVPCRLLGDRALTVTDVAAETLAGGKPNPQYSPLRAFWIEPSMERLFAAGDHFAKTLLTPARRALENSDVEDPSGTPPRLVRYPVPEFDAMKAVLAKGIVAPGGGAWSSPCDDKPVAPAALDHAWRTTPPQCGFPRLALRLPKTRPSLFKAGDRIVGGNATVEEIGAGMQFVEHGKTISGPKWEEDYGTMRYAGAWDIGTYELSLDKPVVEHVIGRTGLVGAYQWLPRERKTPFTRQEDCSAKPTDARRGEQLLPGYPSVNDELMWFYAPQAFAFKKAAIKAHVERGVAPSKDDSDTIKRVVVYEIDLNRDGIPDFIQWEIWSVPDISGPDPAAVKWETYVNVEGKWYPLGWKYDTECT